MGALKRFALLIVFLSLILVPVWISPSGGDMFRYPKELLLRATGVLLLMTVLLRPHEWLRMIAERTPRRETILCGAIAIWTSVTFLTSQNHVLSAYSTAWVSSALLLYFVTCIVTRDLPLRWLFVLGVPAAANAVLFLIQDLSSWNPLFASDLIRGSDRSQWNSAFLGNRNEVATTLAVPLLTMIAHCVVASRDRVLSAALATVIGAAVIASNTATGIVAAGVGMIMLVVTRLAPKRRTLIILSTSILLVTITGITVAVALNAERLDRWVSGRMIAYAAAITIGSERPLVGSGPGTFGWKYFDAKLVVEREHPKLRSSINRRINFGEVHNDYLEIFAETGIPGVLLFASALVIIAGYSLKPDHATNTEQQEFARILGLPLAMTVAMLALAQFPLQIAASTVILASTLGTLTAWQRQ